MRCYTLIIAFILATTYLNAQELNIAPPANTDNGTIAPSTTTNIGMGSYVNSPLVNNSFDKKGGKDRSEEAREREEELKKREEEIEQSKNNPPESTAQINKPQYYYIEQEGNDLCYTLQSSTESGLKLQLIERQNIDSLPEHLKISPYTRDQNIKINPSIAPANIDKVGHGYYLTRDEIAAITTEDAVKNDIETIEVTNDATIITIAMLPATNLFWFNISEKTYIEDCDSGKRYTLLGVEDNIPAGRLVVAVDPPSSLGVKLLFPPLPPSVRRINVIRLIDHLQIPSNTSKLVGGDYNLSLKAYAPKNMRR